METLISREELKKFRNDLKKCSENLFSKFVDTLSLEEQLILSLFYFSECLETFDYILLIRNKFYKFIN